MYYLKEESYLGVANEYKHCRQYALGFAFGNWLDEFYRKDR